MSSNCKFRVLVVEDEPLIAMIIEDVLDALGCEIVGPFAELKDAIIAADRMNFDCGFLDINIRGGLSYPVATLLVDQGIPVLLATGYRSEALPKSLIQESYLTKPYSSAQLEQAVRQLCNRAIHRTNRAPLATHRSDL